MYSAELEQERLQLIEENQRLKDKNQSLKYRLEAMASDTKFLISSLGDSLRDDINNKIDDLVEAIEDMEYDHT